MTTIQCTYRPHHHNGSVAKCSLWTASEGANCLLSTLLVLTLTMLDSATTRPQQTCRHKSIVVMRRMGALDCFHDVAIYMYIYIYKKYNMYIYKYIYIYFYVKNVINANCISIGDLFLLNKNDSQCVISNI